MEAGAPFDVCGADLQPLSSKALGEHEGTMTLKVHLIPLLWHTLWAITLTPSPLVALVPASAARALIMQSATDGAISMQGTMGKS